MLTKKSKVTIHMVCSVDGFIAKKDNDISWMHSTDYYEPGTSLTDEEITNFLKNIDCYVMGSKTYEHALELGWAYGDTPVFVVTKQNLTKDRPTVTLYNGQPKDLVKYLSQSDFRNIWVVGGARITKAFIQQELADELIMTILPVILGDGLPFFDSIAKEQKLHLNDLKAYKDGMVELNYKIIKE